MTLVDTIRQFVENALMSMHISSAGGDSPKINYVRDVDINPADFDQIIRDEVERIIDERLDEVQGDQTKVESDLGTSEGSIESGAVSTIKTGSSLVQNPAGAMGMLMGFMPHAALIALALSLIPIIIKELKRPGSILDVRFKRLMEDEFNAFLSRQEQMNTQLGYRQVIVQSKAGFLAQAGGAGTYNNLVDKRMGGLDPRRQEMVGLVDHAKDLSIPLG